MQNNEIKGFEQMKTTVIINSLMHYLKCEHSLYAQEIRNSYGLGQTRDSDVIWDILLHASAISQSIEYVPSKTRETKHSHVLEVLERCQLFLSVVLNIYGLICLRVDAYNKKFSTNILFCVDYTIRKLEEIYSSLQDYIETELSLFREGVNFILKDHKIAITLALELLRRFDEHFSQIKHDDLIQERDITNHKIVETVFGFDDSNGFLVGYFYEYIIKILVKTNGLNLIFIKNLNVKDFLHSINMENVFSVISKSDSSNQLITRRVKDAINESFLYSVNEHEKRYLKESTELMSELAYFIEIHSQAEKCWFVDLSCLNILLGKDSRNGACRKKKNFLYLTNLLVSFYLHTFVIEYKEQFDDFCKLNELYKQVNLVEKMTDQVNKLRDELLNITNLMYVQTEGYDNLNDSCFKKLLINIKTLSNMFYNGCYLFNFENSENVYTRSFHREDLICIKYFHKQRDDIEHMFDITNDIRTFIFCLKTLDKDINELSDIIADSIYSLNKFCNNIGNEDLTCYDMLDIFENFLMSHLEIFVWKRKQYLKLIGQFLEITTSLNRSLQVSACNFENTVCFPVTLNNLVDSQNLLGELKIVISQLRFKLIKYFIDKSDFHNALGIFKKEWSNVSSFIFFVNKIKQFYASAPCIKVVENVNMICKYTYKVLDKIYNTSEEILFGSSSLIQNKQDCEQFGNTIKLCCHQLSYWRQNLDKRLQNHDMIESFVKYYRKLLCEAVKVNLNEIEKLERNYKIIEVNRVNNQHCDIILLTYGDSFKFINECYQKTELNITFLLEKLEEKMHFLLQRKHEIEMTCNHFKKFMDILKSSSLQLHETFLKFKMILLEEPIDSLITLSVLIEHCNMWNRSFSEFFNFVVLYLPFMTKEAESHIKNVLLQIFGEIFLSKKFVKTLFGYYNITSRFTELVTYLGNIHNLYEKVNIKTDPFNFKKEINCVEDCLEYVRSALGIYQSKVDCYRKLNATTIDVLDKVANIKKVILSIHEFSKENSQCNDQIEKCVSLLEAFVFPSEKLALITNNILLHNNLITSLVKLYKILTSRGFSQQSVKESNLQFILEITKTLSTSLELSNLTHYLKKLLSKDTNDPCANVEMMSNMHELEIYFPLFRNLKDMSLKLADAKFSPTTAVFLEQKYIEIKESPILKKMENLLKFFGPFIDVIQVSDLFVDALNYFEIIKKTFEKFESDINSYKKVLGDLAYFNEYVLKKLDRIYIKHDKIIAKIQESYKISKIDRIVTKLLTLVSKIENILNQSDIYTEKINRIAIILDPNCLSDHRINLERSSTLLITEKKLLLSDYTSNIARRSKVEQLQKETSCTEELLKNIEQYFFINHEIFNEIQPCPDLKVNHMMKSYEKYFTLISELYEKDRVLKYICKYLHECEHGIAGFKDGIWNGSHIGYLCDRIENVLISSRKLFKIILLNISKQNEPQFDNLIIVLIALFKSKSEKIEQLRLVSWTDNMLLYFKAKYKATQNFYESCKEDLKFMLASLTNKTNDGSRLEYLHEELLKIENDLAQFTSKYKTQTKLSVCFMQKYVSFVEKLNNDIAVCNELEDECYLDVAECSYLESITSSSSDSSVNFMCLIDRLEAQRLHEGNPLNDAKEMILHLHHLRETVSQLFEETRVAKMKHKFKRGFRKLLTALEDITNHAFMLEFEEEVSTKMICLDELVTSIGTFKQNIKKLTSIIAAIKNDEAAISALAELNSLKASILDVEILLDLYKDAFSNTQLNSVPEHENLILIELFDTYKNISLVKIENVFVNLSYSEPFEIIQKAAMLLYHNCERSINIDYDTLSMLNSYLKSILCKCFELHLHAKVQITDKNIKISIINFGLWLNFSISLSNLFDEIYRSADSSQSFISSFLLQYSAFAEHILSMDPSYDKSSHMQFHDLEVSIEDSIKFENLQKQYMEMKNHVSSLLSDICRRKITISDIKSELKDINECMGKLSFKNINYPSDLNETESFYESIITIVQNNSAITVQISSELSNVKEKLRNLQLEACSKNIRNLEVLLRVTSARHETLKKKSTEHEARLFNKKRYTSQKEEVLKKFENFVNTWSAKFVDFKSEIVKEIDNFSEQLKFVNTMINSGKTKKKNFETLLGRFRIREETKYDFPYYAYHRSINDRWTDTYSRIENYQTKLINELKTAKYNDRGFHINLWLKSLSSFMDRKNLQLETFWPKEDICSKTSEYKNLTPSMFQDIINQIGFKSGTNTVYNVFHALSMNSVSIQYSEFCSLLTSMNSLKKIKASDMSVENAINCIINQEIEKCTCDEKIAVKQVPPHRIMIGKIKLLARFLESTVMVRVGGGWEELPFYMNKSDPCRLLKKSRMKNNLEPEIAKMKILSDDDVRKKPTQKEIIHEN